MAARRRAVNPTRRVALPFSVGGGMDVSGDLANKPPGTSGRIANLFVRQGRVEMRPGWLQESGLPSAILNGGANKITLMLPEAGSFDTVKMVAISAAGAAYMSGASTWTALSGIKTDSNQSDYANFLGKMYFHGITTGDVDAIMSFDGSSVNTNAVSSDFYGSSLAVFNSRLYAGPIYEKPVNQVAGGASMKFEDATKWTLTGATAANASGLRTLTINAATDSLKTTAAAYTPGATEEYLTVQPQFRSKNATANMPFTITVENAAGSTIYGSYELVVSNATVQPDWQTFAFSVRIPASTAVYVKYAAGTTAITGVTGSVDVADENNAKGLRVSKGRRIYAAGAEHAALSSPNSYPNRFAWCEVNDPTFWAGSSYYDCQEVPGKIVGIRALNGRVGVFKREAIWVFGPQDNANLPIILDKIIHNVGARHPKSIVQFEDHFYFVGNAQIYKWDLLGEPQPLLAPGMQERLFSDMPYGFAPALAINAIRRELYFTPTSNDLLYVYNLDTSAWSYLTAHGETDTRVSAGGKQALFIDVVYTRPTGEQNYSIWASLFHVASDGVTVTQRVVKLRELDSVQTQDNIAGSALDASAEYWLRPIQSDPPRDTYILESVEIDHKVTASQAGSTTSYQVSYDGGTTFGNYNTVTLAPLASGDYQPMQLPLWESHERMLVSIKHTGLTGPTYFNLSGGNAIIQPLGEKTQRTNPTAVSSSL